MEHGYRVIWYDWHNEIHLAVFFSYEDAKSYTEDILDSYSYSHIASIDYISLKRWEYVEGNPHPHYVEDGEINVKYNGEDKELI